MPFIDEILAEIQDPEQQKALKGLPEPIIKALEKRAALAADANQKLAKLADAETRLQAFEKANTGWTRAKAILDGAYGEKYDLAEVVKADKARQAENDWLKAEVEKLKPEVARAAELARQAEGEAVDPNKITELVLEKAKGQFISKADIEEIVKRAVGESKHAVDYGSIPGTVKLVESVMKAHNQYGLDISADDLATAAGRYTGPDALDRAYGDLTKTARENLAAKNAKEAEDKRLADLAAAEHKGAEAARREYEMAHMQGEEAGSSVLGTVPLNAPKEGQKGVDPTKYDPSAGTLADQAIKHYRELEAEGFHKLM